MAVDVRIVVDYKSFLKEEKELIKRTVTFVDNLSNDETKIYEDVVPENEPFNNEKTKQLNSFIAQSFQLNAVKMSETNNK